MMVITLELVKRYFWSIFGVVGVVAFWAGIWDGIGSLPYLSNPLISLAIGLLMLTFSGLIFKEFNPLKEAEESVMVILHKVHKHPLKHQFHIRYFDKIKKKPLLFQATKLKKLEKAFLVLEHEGKELFVPAHRVTEILHKKKRYWSA